ncbi:hypothetical protein NDU88_001381 [Pleurodeles waltl]|uniref:Actin-binding Rho-activating protein n=1 Tax=Pleurodeles waltl TaxID=8319 RepID=A0AAV7PB16_PLEWA|nr:hypothetical protein NDU88_001381 [Pleurodeles waltl]
MPSQRCWPGKRLDTESVSTNQESHQSDMSSSVNKSEAESSQANCTCGGKDLIQPSSDSGAVDTGQAMGPQVKDSTVNHTGQELMDNQGLPAPGKPISSSVSEQGIAKCVKHACKSDGPGTEEKDEIRPSSKDGVEEEAAMRRKMLLSKVKITTMADVRMAWQCRSEEHQENQRRNPFSEDFDHAHAMSVRLKKGDRGYGRPKEGSATEKRGQRAHQHVRKEMEDLCLVIRDMGVQGRDGHRRVTFGRLFEHYVRVSDKVVGILLRARKHGMLDFEGEMLWQGVHDHILITLLDDKMT